MKAIYYTVTFLAALVVLAFAGWQTYLHKDVIIGNVPVLTKKCACNTECKCNKETCRCSAENSCSPDCDCVKAAPACCEPKTKK